MRLLRTIAPVLLAFALLAGMTASIAAQDEPAATPEAGLPEGLEKWYSRSATTGDLSPLAPASPEAVPSGWFILLANVLEFDSEENAAAGFDDLVEQVDAEDAAAEEIEFADVDLDLDVDYMARLAEQEDAGLTSVVIQAFAQDGEYVYVLIGATFGADPVPLTEYVMQHMEAAEVGDDTETLNAEGTSEGGLWSKFPMAEEITAEEPSLTIFEDAIAYPVLATTPPA